MQTANTITSRTGDLAHYATPERTATWEPVPHFTAARITERMLDDMGVGVRSIVHEITPDGLNLFSNYHLDLPALNGQGNFTAALRNSNAKLFTIGLALGNNAWACANMCFFGEFISMRKHTKGLRGGGLSEFLADALYHVIMGREQVDKWHKGLAAWYVTPDHLKILAFNMVMAGAFSGSQLTNFKNAVDDEVKINTGYRTLYQVHGAGTRLMRGSNMQTMPDRTRRLNAVCEDYVDLYKERGGIWS